MADIKSQMKSGIFWTALAKYSGLIVSILISMVLARLLTPYEFGVVATASVILGFLTILSSVGIAPAIIQRKDLDQDDLNNIFTFTVIIATIMASVSFASSWIIADFYGNPLLKPVVMALSVGIFFSTINMIPSALMSKNLRFKETATRTIFFQLFFGLLGIISAFFGAGVYALVCPQIFSYLCTFLYNNHFYPVKINWRFSIEPVKKIFSYSIYVFLSDFINYFARNLDKLIIGKCFSAAELGYYEKSYRLMQMPLNNVSAVINPVMQPILSSLQDNMEEMARKYTKIVGIIASFSFPVAIMLYASASEIIYVMFGEQWSPAVPSFKILSLSIPIILICNPNAPVFLACNASKRMFRVIVFNTSVTITGFTIAAFAGTIESMALAWTIGELFGTSFSYYQLYRKVMNQSLLPVLKSLIQPFLCSLILIAIYFAYYLLIPSGLPILLNLICKMAIGVVAVMTFLKVTGRFDVIRFLRTRLHK